MLVRPARALASAGGALASLLATRRASVSSAVGQRVSSLREAMSLALRVATASASTLTAEVPVGALVYRAADGLVLAAAHNCVERCQLATAHAEMEAIRGASAALRSWRLSECTLVCTLEPCDMCAAAIALARVPRVVFGAYRTRALLLRACTAHDECAATNSMHAAADAADDGVELDAAARVRFGVHCAQLRGGVMEDECASLLRAFFRRRRSENAALARGSTSSAESSDGEMLCSV